MSEVSGTAGAAPTLALAAALLAITAMRPLAQGRGAGVGEAPKPRWHLLRIQIPYA